MSIWNFVSFSGIAVEAQNYTQNVQSICILSRDPYGFRHLSLGPNGRHKSKNLLYHILSDSQNTQKTEVRE